MKNIKIVAGSLTMALLATACAQEPMGPHVGVMPGQNKPFPVFQQDDAVCRQFASNQTAGQAQQANNQAVGTAVVGTLLGAGLGAAIGGGQGAAIGAASGAVGGTAIGAGTSSNQQYGIQQQYDIAYSQCMYSRGNQVQGYGPAPHPHQGPGPGYSQPPAPGYPPPPAPGY
jgi:hypothetical protein